jgi:hypothetical protein
MGLEEVEGRGGGDAVVASESSVAPRRMGGGKGGRLEAFEPYVGPLMYLLEAIRSSIVGPT